MSPRKRTRKSVRPDHHTIRAAADILEISASSDLMALDAVRVGLGISRHEPLELARRAVGDLLGQAYTLGLNCREMRCEAAQRMLEGWLPANPEASKTRRSRSR